MRIEQVLEKSIKDNNDSIELLTYRIEGMKKSIPLQNDKISELKLAEELTKAKDRVMFHKGCVEAYTDILNLINKALKKE